MLWNSRLHGAFYFESLPDVLCCACVWLTVWLDLLRAAWRSCCLLLSKTVSARIHHAAQQKAASETRPVAAGGATRIVQNGSNQLWPACRNRNATHLGAAEKKHCCHQCVHWAATIFFSISLQHVTNANNSCLTATQYFLVGGLFNLNVVRWLSAIGPTLIQYVSFLLLTLSLPTGTHTLSLRTGHQIRPACVAHSHSVTLIHTHSGLHSWHIRQQIKVLEVCQATWGEPQRAWE